MASSFTRFHAGENARPAGFVPRSCPKSLLAGLAAGGRRPLPVFLFFVLKALLEE